METLAENSQSLLEVEVGAPRSRPSSQVELVAPTDRQAEESISVLVSIPPEVVERVIAKWLASYHNANTRSSYERDLYHFSEWVANKGGKLSQVTRSTVDVYVGDLLEDGKSNPTICRSLAALSSFYLFSNDEGVPLAGGTNPAGRIRRPKVSDESPCLGLDKAEAKALMVAAEANPRDEVLVALLLMNGFRVSEALSIRFEDVKTEAGHTVVFLTRKSGVSARAPLNPFTLRAMDRVAEGRETGLVVTTRNGRHLNRHYAGKIINRLAKKAGIGHRISPHSLRHTFITLSLEAGVPLHDVQDSAGHKSPQTTMRYNRARHSLDRHATHALGAFLS